MDYHAHYDKLIERARDRLLEGYGEWHHILPRCMGGDDEKENLVHLTAEEHYVAHQLLVKMHPKNGKLIYALHALSAFENNAIGRSKNKTYGWVRRKHSIHQSKKMKEQYRTGKRKPWNLGIPLSEEHKKKQSKALKGRKLSPEHRLKVIAANASKIGVPLSAAHRKKVSESLMGHSSNKKGKSFDEIYGDKAKRIREEISAKLKGIKQEQVTCPHCDQIGGRNAMLRFHFDNCAVKYPDKKTVQSIVTCPHCDKTGGYTLMSRYHFDNCSIKNPDKKTVQAKLTCPHCDKTGGNSLMVRYHFDNCEIIQPDYKPPVPIHEVVTCPHCDKSGGIRAMKRWHFDKCKMLQSAK